MKVEEEQGDDKWETKRKTNGECKEQQSEKCRDGWQNGSMQKREKVLEWEGLTMKHQSKIACDGDDDDWETEEAVVCDEMTQLIQKL
jgi:hypothetical protein